MRLPLMVQQGCRMATRSQRRSMASSPATPGPGWRRTSKGGWSGSSDTPRANSTCWPGWKKQRGERVGLWAATPSIWPVKGHVSSRFGPRISPFTGKRAFHAGLDISGPRGKTVRAPAKGKVVEAAYDWKIGNFIRINHRYGVETIYGHLSKLLVRDGQEVKRGDVLGLIGSTGRYSTGPHLHYQIAVNDKVVDPLQYILD